MSITAIVGKIGSGKSFKQLHYALEQCNHKRKKLVTNFALNLKELRKYAAMMRYGWVAHIVDTGQIACIDAANSIEDLLIYPESVVCLDEAGIFLNSREFAKTPKGLLMDLAQSRKTGCDLIYASQFDEQVDKQMRMLTQWFIYADGFSVYDKALRRPRLIAKKYSYFDAESYFDWSADPKIKGSMLHTMFKSFKSEFSFVGPADRQLFKVFDSFARLEKQQLASREMHSGFIPVSISDNVSHTYRSALQRDIKKHFGGVFVETPAYHAPRCKLPYDYQPGCLTVQYVQKSALQAGWCMAESLPDFSCKDFTKKAVQSNNLLQDW